MAKQQSLYGNTPKCYESHPALEVGGLKFYGGSCITPAHKDADVYIGFDRNMTIRNYRPWKGEEPKQDVYFFIQDMSIPADAEEFKALAEWAIQQAKDGKKVHAGCIGGHGRTGMFMALVTQLLQPELNAIDFVRENYCHHAVETVQQEKFLQHNYGCKPPVSLGKHANLSSSWHKGNSVVTGSGKKYDIADTLAITPVAAHFSIFDKT